MKALKSNVSNRPVFLVLLACLVSVPLCAQEISLTEEERAWLKAHPKIQLGYTDAFEPEVILNPDGTCSGMLVDFLDALNAKLGTDVGLRIYPIPELLEKAKTKEIDGILNIHPEYADSLGLLKTQAYWPSYPAVFASRGVSFEGHDDFVGKRVSIIDKVYFSQKLMSQYGQGATILKVDDALEGLRSVEKGDVDFFLGASVFSYFITKYQLLGVVPAYVFFESPEMFGIGIRPDWPQLVSILDTVISTFSEKEINAILERWSYLPIQQDQVELTPEEQAWLGQNHTVRVRIINFPPFMILDKGKAQGISIDYLKLISERTGITFEFVEETRPFADALESMKNLEGPDLIQCMTHTKEREAYASFSKDYLSSPRVIITRDDQDFVSTIVNLQGRTIAAPAGTVVSNRLAADYPEIKLLLFDSDEKSLAAVASGKADAYVGNLTLATFLIKERGFANLKVAAPSPLGDHVFSFGIRKDWPELAGIIDKALDTLSTKERDAILSKYLSMKYEYGIGPGDVVKWVLIVAGVAAFIIVVFITWNRTLHRVVKERTATLAESEERFRATFEQAAVGIAHVSPEGRFLRINQKFCDLVGYSHEEMLQRTFQEITYPDDLDADLKYVNQLISGAINTYSMEKRYIRKSGESVWTELTVALMRDTENQPRWFVSVVKDITQRKRVEETLQAYQKRLKRLASQLTLAEERERRRIAGDLHDHVGQSLALARLQLATASKRTADSKLAAVLDDVSESLRRAVEETRHLIFDLSSPSMNELGLSAALSEWLEEQLQKRYGLRTHFVDECGRVPLEDDVRAILFRSVRELLTNVVKHAHANEVTVSLKRAAACVRIVIQDDGVGFDPHADSEMTDREGGFGLFSIRERMSDLGGTLEIESEPGKGCKAILTAPLSVE